MTEKGQEILIGIDLGTSQSAISTSTGEKHVVASYVGWPVDAVARKILKKDVLFGQEAVDNRTMLDLHRPLERGLLKEGSEKDQQAIRELLGHLMDLAGVSAERKKGAKVRAVVGVPAEALRVNKQHVREAMRGFVDGLIIVSEPFAVAYGLDALLHAIVVDVGAGTTDFCVMRGRYPTEEDQRTLTNAGDWVDEQLAKLLKERHPGINVSIHTVRGWKEASSFMGKAPNPVVVSVPIAGKPSEIDITEEMRQACEALGPPVAEAMLDLIAAAESEYQEQVRNNVILAGGTSAIPGFGAYLANSLLDFGGGKIRKVKDPVFVGADGGLALAMDAPKSDWEKLPG
ncbi:MAG: rod shape-determining protein [Thermoanaerobaculales bacterium]|nr:rod shape-determining protein [Thermoanaerobaculales bacterium]